ncbi:3D domain-containing protein [Sphingobium sp. AP50]|uniref:3D domain-containing protein n=1 Tax=Sphingobium sp. AP50 TaxID=1884369 RepID=UPI000B88503C
MLNVDGVVGGATRWRVVANDFRLDAVWCLLVPFRSAAVDRTKIPLRTRLFIPETVGMPLPSGAMHDGGWYAMDTGSAIMTDRIDLFLGAGKAIMDIPRQFGIGHLRTLKARIVVKVSGCERPGG